MRRFSVRVTFPGREVHGLREKGASVGEGYRDRSVLGGHTGFRKKEVRVLVLQEIESRGME